MELLNYILRWVVSVDLDMKSLENFSEVKVVFNNYHPVEISNMSKPVQAQSNFQNCILLPKPAIMIILHVTEIFKILLLVYKIKINHQILFFCAKEYHYT